MQSSAGHGNELIFVIEQCTNCGDHGWNTRHNEVKYNEYFDKVSKEIIELIPNAITLRNQIPKSYLHYDLYCNLIPNEEPDVNFYNQVPRTGAFEVSYQGHLIFSKLQGGYWPNSQLVASKCSGIVDALQNGGDLSSFLAGVTPNKEGSPSRSTRKGRGGSPAKAFNDTGMSEARQMRLQPAAAPQLDQDQPLRAPSQNQQQIIPPEPVEQAQPAVQQPPPEPVEEDIQAGPHIKKPDDITGFPIFPPGTKSLLSKNLDRDLWNRLKNKQDDSGFSFKASILSGVQNIDSGIGVYAGSLDTYGDELMERIIEQYHGHSVTAQHISNMDYNQLQCPPFPPEDAAMIKSTRIRVGRNLADYPLGPAISREQRLEVESKVLQACDTLQGELAGKFYSLGSLSEGEINQLVADHFLFKEGDRFLDAAGLNRNWPEGRGIFHNNEKTFLVWVNEEDQLRVISMQQGADIGEVFTRLSKACAHFESVARFSHTKNLGYITSCPTNLGTALRASVHIALPKLGAQMDEFEKIADEFNVQIRGIHGEHSESADHVYDISNRRRLGRSEVDLVQDMYNGVKAMIEKEKELGGGIKLAPVEVDIEAGPHVKNPDDITGFPVFAPGIKSLLAQNLSHDIWNELKDTKDACGFPFKAAILSGVQNVDSGIGVYAGCHESYTSFAPLMDKIIEQYHGHGKNAQHISDMDHNKLQCPPFAPEDAAMIKSTRIRVGRNLAEFPLGPGITREQRNEIEQKVVQACNTFEGELSGTFYSLSSLTDDERNQLIADHFLFKEGDRFLDACGLNRNWPEGRGIFHNNEKTFLVWVNEEDQLRIISMQQGADIGAVFTRLSKACAHIEGIASFAHDSHLGYITSCPTNLGTALRASVHIALPKLGVQMDEFQKIADQYNVQIRGIHGEHSESADHVYDISNRRRLGRSEVDLVQDMYNGVKAMIEKEKELGGGISLPAAADAQDDEYTEEEEEVKAGPHIKDPSEITGFPVFPDGTKSLLSKTLDKAVWDELKDKKDACGFPFKGAILSGVQNVDSGIGVYAGCHDSYTSFAPLMDKIIEQYHGHGKEAQHVSDMDHNKLDCPPFSAEDAAMIKSTRIRVGRNLAEFPLGPGITREQRNEIEQKVVQACKTFEEELAGTFYSLSDLTDDQREQLIADHFLFKEGDRFLEACGLNRDWPEGRGIFHNNDKTFLVWVNEEDQLRIISMQPGADIGAVFTRLSKACAHIEGVASFAHDSHLGYITSCPTNLGTALRASVHIALPNLGVKMDEFQKIADQYNVQIRGIHGEHSESADHVYDISNRRRLGRSEVDLVQDMYNGVKAMIEKEKELGAGGAEPPAESQNDADSAKEITDDAPAAEAPQLPPFPSELMAELDAQALEGYTYWKANATEEQNAAAARELELYTKDPSYAAGQMKLMQDLFTAADVNSNGVLTIEEFQGFYRALQDDGESRGNFEDHRPETVTNTYGICDRINPDKPGVSLEDFQAFAFNCVQKTEELKSKDK